MVIVFDSFGLSCHGSITKSSYVILVINELWNLHSPVVCSTGFAHNVFLFGEEHIFLNITVSVRLYFGI